LLLNLCKKEAMTRLLFTLLMLMIFVHTTEAQVNLNNGLVAYYPFDGNLLDASINTNHGSPNGTVIYTTDRFGNANSAVRFQGVGNPGRVDVPIHPTLQFTTEATFTFWMRQNSAFGTFGNGTTGNGGFQCPFTKNGDQGGGLWHLSTFSNNALNNTFGNVGMTTTAAGLNPYSLGQWVHMTYVMGATESRIYINGELVNTWVGSPNYSVMNNRILSFGRFITNWYPFNGDLDDFRVYNRAINQDEINALNNVTVPTISINLTQTTFCAGAPISINYTATEVINPGNLFKVQLSDAAGSFANPIEIGSIPSSALSGTLQATIPEITSSGNGYKIRVQSTNVGAISNESQNITITGILATIPDPALYNYIGSFNGIHYYLSTNQLTWTAAAAQALANGGHLAVVPNAQVNNFLQANNSGLQAYIGLTDEVTEGTFLWVDGTPLNYTNWSPGEPNNAGGGNGEDYVIMFPNGRWNDGPGGPAHYFMQLRPAGIPQNSCTGGTINLNGAMMADAIYSWTGPDNFSSSIPNPTITNASIANSGTYTLTHTLSGCSISNTTTVTVNQSPVNLGENATLLTSLNNGLVVHLPMNGNANDISGNGFNGTISGGVVAAADRFGNAGQALQFTGNNGHIQLPSANYFDGSPFTVTVWANRSSNANWNRCFDFGNGNPNDNVIFAYSNGTTGRVTAEIYNGIVSGGAITAGTSNTTPLNQWIFFAYTWENGIGSVFANNNLLATGAQSAPENILRTLNYIGRSNWAQDAYFTGFMDDFRIYNRALNPTEIRNLFMQQSLNMTVAANPEFLCAANPANITLSNSQFGVSYRLRNSNTSAFVGNAQNGNGGNLVFSTGSINQTTAFEIVATTIGTNCTLNLSPNTIIQFGPAAQPTIVADGAVELCDGQQVNLSIPATSGATYQWKRNNVNIGTSINTFTATEAGTYTVDVINTCGTVSSTNSIVVVNLGTAPTAPVISAAGPISVCEGQTVALSVPTQSGVTYQWKRNGINVGTNSNNFTANQSGTYTIELLSPCGDVVSTNSIAVTISGQLPTAPTIAVNGNLTFCEGGSAALSVPNQTGVSYQWKRNNTNVGSNSNSFTATQSGTYTIEVSNSCGSILSSNSVVITVNPIPTTPVISANGPLSFCEGQNVVLSLPSAQSYLWSNGATSQSITVNTSGTYTGQVIQNGCSSAVSQNTVVIVNIQPVAPTFISNSEVCAGNSATLSVNSTADVSWFTTPTGGISIGNGTSFNTAPLFTTTTFYAEAINGACISATRTAVSVTVNPSPELNLISVTPVACSGTPTGSVNINATNANEFSWSNGVTTQNLSNVLAGNYTLTATSSNGCTSTLNVVVEDQNPILVQGIINPISCNTGGSISLSISGGAGPYSINWNHGPNTELVSINDPGIYTVTITDAIDCSKTEVFELLPYISITATADITDQTLNPANGSINLSITGGNPPYFVSWNGGLTGSSISGLASGTYTATITDADGCSIQESYLVSSTVGLTDLVGIEGVSIYPNPAKDVLYLDLKNNKQSIQYSIFDISGRIISEGRTMGNSVNLINISSMRAGVYFIRLNDLVQHQTFKFQILK